MTSFILLLIEISGKKLILNVWLICDYWSASNTLSNDIHIIQIITLSQIFCMFCFDPQFCILRTRLILAFFFGRSTYQPASNIKKLAYVYFFEGQIILGPDSIGIFKFLFSIYFFFFFFFFLFFFFFFSFVCLWYFIYFRRIFLCTIFVLRLFASNRLC